MMRELKIRVQYNADKIMSVVETSGFSDGLKGKIELIGLLEDLKHVELQKINTAISANNKGECYINDKYKIPDNFEIVNDEDTQEFLDKIDDEDKEE